MRLRNIPGAEEEMLVNPFVIRSPEEKKGTWKSVYENPGPLQIEIGCGKGRFLSELSLKHPEVNYLGIEKFSSVLLRALEKRALMECTNLYFLRFDAEALDTVFAPGEIDKIYLNFSDPWPKARHHKRRLTSREFLARYEKVLSPGGTVEFKTDNVKLFDFSIEEAESEGWEILEFTRDLHKSPMNEGNIMTEYEEKFSLLGNKICKLIMKPGV
ncbi:MAG: tRNA (guanosine(46)-N7)-methyltransferase TrmB [Lachnospiraceae bacterium]|nr:tRNA (guanosine(46)-N7)-methyltransferase TrmB [Lachnospiraceae bacterium]